jgi:hypothetical protein
MPHNPQNRLVPVDVPQVMVSSTFEDLKEHRAALIAELNRHKLHPNVMEHHGARLLDVIDSSLGMVRESAGYIGIISLKYGQNDHCPTRNPQSLSLTELEFDEAQRHGRPILLFVMDESHLVTKADIERDPAKEKKLNAFRERAMKSAPGSSINRVYATFASLQDLKDQLGASLAELAEKLSRLPGESASLGEAPAEPGGTATPIPKPPALYAEPNYIGSHRFVGREAQLQGLSDWARAADPANLLLFEAIGGNGKSMLTWEWVTNPKHALAARSGDDPWAGRLWYSFYEKGAVMADFCRRALAYMTGQPLEELQKRKTADLKDEVLAQLRARPWLVVLDGLERVLVAYHRADAAQVSEEEASSPTDQMAKRDPRSAIRDEDDDLLRALAAVRPSKILVSSRLTPRVLLNASDQEINGVRRINLLGLRPPDAERLLSSCGVYGDSASIQRYLAANCDNHPLVIGILGGLIRNYLPARGDFDCWVATDDGGAKLDLATLDLVQRRNHILRAAFEALSPEGHELLCTLALLSDSVDYHTLEALSPFNSGPSPELSPADRAKLAETVHDVESRGLLQFDHRTGRYDLHPVIRGAASRFERADARETYGQRVIDHFSLVAHRPYEQADSLDDLKPGLNVVRTLIKLGRLEQAFDELFGGLGESLVLNLEAHSDYLALTRPFFTHGWDRWPETIASTDVPLLANNVALVLNALGQSQEALATLSAVLTHEMARENWGPMTGVTRNVALCLQNTGRIAKTVELARLSVDMASALGDDEELFMSRLLLCSCQCYIGELADADATWQLLDPMDRKWSRGAYRAGSAEGVLAHLRFRQGTLSAAHLDIAQRLAIDSKSPADLRSVHALRGLWQQQQHDWSGSADSYREVVRLTRQAGIVDATAEARLALAKFRLGELPEPQQEAERLALLKKPGHLALAELWRALGDDERATHHSLAAYKEAWCDGEPYVDRYTLAEAAELLRQMDVPIPNLAPYDPTSDAALPWEASLRAAIKTASTLKMDRQQK